VAVLVAGLFEGDSEEGAKPVSECRARGTFVVDLPIEGHEELNGGDLRIGWREPFVLVKVLVHEVVNGVAEELERAAGTRGDVERPAASCSNAWGVDAEDCLEIKTAVHKRHETPME
jgi:hypothetical protein